MSTQNLRTLLTIIAIATIIGGWLYIGLLKAQIEKKDIELSNTRIDLKNAVDTANKNAEAVRLADDEHKKTLSLLNELTISLQQTSTLNRELEREIAAGEGGDDGDVAPVLQNLRLRKFGGGVQ